MLMQVQTPDLRPKCCPAACHNGPEKGHHGMAQAQNFASVDDLTCTRPEYQDLMYELMMAFKTCQHV